MKYNYVILGSPEDYYKVAYGELKDKEYAYCLMDGIDCRSKLIQYLFKIHTSKTTQKIINLPFKEIWNSYIFRHPFSDDKPICFVFFSRSVLCNSKVIGYLRIKFPGSKFVAFWQDLVSKVQLKDFDLLKSSYLDICLSFDQGDCNKYGMTYYPLVYSYYDKISDIKFPDSDVYFVGRAKDRLHTIIAAYERFRDAGLRCDFNITGVKKKDRVYSDLINYCDSLPYIENIEHIKATKCMLEIMQGGGVGFTLRYAEAVMYDKKMITNNQAIKDAPFYAPNRINVFKDLKDIDVRFPVEEPIQIDYGFKENLYPSKMLRFIDNRLSDVK